MRPLDKTRKKFIAHAIRNIPLEKLEQQVKQTETQSDKKFWQRIYLIAKSNKQSVKRR